MENQILKKLKEPLKIEDVDFRIQSISDKGWATILAYKDARLDMNRLDEVCGALWQDKYELIDGQLFCSIGIKIEDEWIWRQDVGVESMTEKQKGRASDAFKRAGFRWGIGRELYDYPRIFLQLKESEFTVKGGKAKQTYDLKLNEWKWDLKIENGVVKSLTAKDQNGNLRYDSNASFNGAPKGNTPKTAPKPQPKKEEPKEKPVLKKMDGKNFTREWLSMLKGYNTKQIQTMEDVKKYFTVPNETVEHLNELFKYQPA